MHLIFCFLVVALITACSSKPINVAKSDAHVWSVCQACDTPESVYYDPESGIVFISNIVGGGDKKDGKGWIQTYTPEGKVLKEKWVSGLNGPKGMRASNGKLWVSDIDRIVRIDIKKAKVEKKFPVRGAKFLNDVAISEDGRVFVSDTIAGMIVEVSNGKVSTFAKGPQLESPNGLLVRGNKLIVASWGITTDWTTKIPGRIYTLDLETKKQAFITEKPFGNLDGLEISNKGDYLVSDWVAGKVFRVDSNGKPTEIFTGMQGAADIGYISAHNLIIIPRMGENKITSFKLN